MDAATGVALPGGLWAGGKRYQQARLRPLVGRDEEALLGGGALLPAARRTTELLSRCVVELGPGPVDADVIRRLSVGDREALLWQLRRLTIGERLDAVVDCARCGEKIGVELAVGDLLQPPYERWEPQFVERLDGHDVTFRVPTGDDQERVAALAAGDPAAATRELLAGCVSAVDGAPQREFDGLVEPLARCFAELDPQAETLLDGACPGCAEPFSVPLDAGGFLVEEVTHGARWLFREVHILAWHYHWSEAEIVALTAARRRRYLDLIAEALNGEAP